jgi:hypothetical protein
MLRSILPKRTMSRTAELQLSLDDLHKVYPALARALAEAGEPNPRIAELLSQHVRIQCVGCHQPVTGEELAELALTHDHPDTPATSPTLQRLRLGYCARPECKSRFYQALASSGMVAWPTVFERTRHFIQHPPSTVVDPPPAPPDAKSQPGQGSATVAAKPTDTEEPEAPKALPFREQWRRLKFAALGVVALLGLLFWWFNSGARIPGLGPAPRQFEVIAGPEAGAPTAIGTSKPTTNAPRSFRVVQ